MTSRYAGTATELIASIIAVIYDSAHEADLSDELTVEFVEMVRNWKRIDDEHQPPEPVRDIAEAVPSLFDPQHYRQLLNQMNEEMHQLIMKFMGIKDSITTPEGDPCSE